MKRIRERLNVTLLEIMEWHVNQESDESYDLG